MLFNFLKLLVCVVILTGCSSNLMVKSKSNLIENPSSEYATIVFMRSSFVAGAIGVELFEINNGEFSFVGALPNGSKIAHKTTPGEKVFMAFGGAADFMIAKVEQGNTYYSIVVPNWGTGGFAPTPIKLSGSGKAVANSPDFMQWKKSTNLIEKKAGAQAWFETNKKKYEKIYNEYWKRFQNKTDAEKLERTLQPTDAIK
jgi:hypothetical protein